MMDIDSCLVEARNLWENAHYIDAYELYERLAKEHPLDARILRDNGLAYYAESDMDIALQLLERSDAIYSNNIVTVL
jgi:tetratricopeptide (TPR) repeat protein